MLNQALVDRTEVREKRYDIPDSQSRSSVQGLLLRVEASGRKTWYLRYAFRGKRRMRRVGDASLMSLAVARAEARSMRLKVETAAIGLADDPFERAPELEEAIPLGRYIEDHYAPTVQMRKSGPDSILRLQRCFSKTALWEMSIDDPGLMHAVVAWRQKRLATGTMHATVNRDTAVLKAALSHAVDAELLPAHPLRKVRPLKEVQENRVRYLTEDEEARLWDALSRREEKAGEERASANRWRSERGYALLPDLRSTRYVDHLAPLIILAVNTGMRRGELFSLEWRDVDFNARVLTVRGEIAKSGKSRRIPLNETAMSTLQEWGDEKQRAGLVFPSPVTGKRLDNIRKSWEALMEDAAISDFRFHDLRHHFASCLVMNGVPLNTVRELLGHASIQMTLRYAHLAPQAGHDAVATMVARQGRVVSGQAERTP